MQKQERYITNKLKVGLDPSFAIFFSHFDQWIMVHYTKKCTSKFLLIMSLRCKEYDSLFMCRDAVNPYLVTTMLDDNNIPGRQCEAKLFFGAVLDN